LGKRVLNSSKITLAKGLFGFVKIRLARNFNFIKDFSTMSSQETQTPMQAIEALLSENEFVSQYQPVAGEKHPVEQLFVALGKDQKDRLYTLEMHFVNDVSVAIGGPSSSDDAFVLQFFVPMPFESGTKHLDDLGRSILAINRLLPMGALGLSDTEGHVYFQYNLTLDQKRISEKVLMEVLSVISFFIGEFSPKVEQVGLGELTFKKFVAQLKEMGIDLVPLAGNK
jgi:hypothetical protein